MDLFCSQIRFGAWLLVAPALIIGGCKADTRLNRVLSSVANASPTLRASVILRQYWVDGKFDTAPTTYVLLYTDRGKAVYENGEDFPETQVLMKPSRCGPLSLAWVDKTTLKVTGKQCGLALSAVGGHLDGQGQTRIEFAGFPDVWSWERAPHSELVRLEAAELRLTLSRSMRSGATLAPGSHLTSEMRHVKD